MVLPNLTEYRLIRFGFDSPSNYFKTLKNQRIPFLIFFKTFQPRREHHKQQQQQQEKQQQKADTPMEVDTMPTPRTASLKRTRDEEEGEPVQSYSGRGRADRDMNKTRSLSVPASPRVS